VPLAQFVTNEPVRGIETPVWKSTDRYLPEEDPLQRIPQPASQAHLFYYHCDHIGTPYMMTDELGDVVWEATYKAWGETQQVIAKASQAAGIAPANPLRFQGQQEDAETGLHYNRHRYYDPSVGRYISTDPIKLAGGLNLHQYAPSPSQWTDALGLSSSGCHGKAVIRQYAPDDEGDRFGHYTITTLGSGGKVSSHQVITSDDYSHTKISHDTSGLGLPVHTINVDLPDASAAQSYQREIKGKDLGPYDLAGNSCVTHVFSTLQAGGADVPQGAKEQFKWLRQNGAKIFGKGKS
jgi:RHS repeat-associated protein